ncbi:hypothetical protein GZ78_01955 [Endozoicomonas numazuensis]|uniref:Uncharacterized protein n=1 Tax=Endozoicomonas numazuensis TaxID=1137799 RepID=A0A081NK80_9GAMM|nr:hypothetical protein GZ78_01955 [Endozoicomonas numazuensis]
MNGMPLPVGNNVCTESCSQEAVYSRPASFSQQSRMDPFSTAVFFIMTYAIYRGKHFAAESVSEDRTKYFSFIWV